MTLTAHILLGTSHVTKEFKAVSYTHLIKKEGTKDTVIAVMSAKKNHSVSIDSGDISKISLTSVTYFDEGDLETIDFSTIPFFVKNGKILSSPSDEEIAPLNGTVLLICLLYTSRCV